MRRLAFIGWILLSSLLSAQISVAQQAALDLGRLQRATVFIMQARNTSSDLIIHCVSSGTLVSRDGLILTNAHSVVKGDSCPGETLVIALTIRLDEPPIPKYRAEIVQADSGLDVALLRITRELDGRLITPGSLSLPFVELGDSSSVRLDQTITVVGYPGIGNDPVNATRGTISGFASEPRGGSVAWIKTSAVIPGSMSGGGAYNQDGRLVAIPTTAPLAVGMVNTTCLPVQDTNHDKLVNNGDICIPLGGFINSLRPSNFARPLLRAASLGLSVEMLSVSDVSRRTTNTPAFKRLFFSPSVNEAGMPTSVIRSLPAGSNSLYLFFDYENMTPETVYELRVTTDGIPNPTFSLAPVRWSGGERGLWYIGSNGQPWPNGVYEFTLFANGVAAPTARLTIGVPPTTDPAFSDIVFGLLDLRNNPLGNGYVLPSGNIASARFIFRNLQNGTNWISIWYLDGKEFSRQANIWNEGANGSTTTSIRSDSGLPPGSFRLELYIENRLAATADFTVAGAQQGAFPAIFSKTRFVTANTDTEALTAVSLSNFPNTINTLYMLFDWQQIAPGTIWTMRWSVDNVPFFDQTLPWNAAQSGQNFLTRLSTGGTIPDGTYTLDLLVNNVQLASTKAQIGIGQLPIDSFAQASGVQLRGQILDADTRKGIPGVTFVLISKEFSVSEFNWDQKQIYALAVTDRNGRFELTRPLDYLTLYSAIIAAQGYLPISADGIEIKTDSPNPIELTIYMTRD
jgi:hypothetical protein